MTDTKGLGPEDDKLITLARASRARNAAAEGAAVRDETGRTYVATTVELPSLRLSALQAAVAAAVSGEASALEAAVVVTDATEMTEDDRAVADDHRHVIDCGILWQRENVDRLYFFPEWILKVLRNNDPRKEATDLSFYCRVLQWTLRLQLTIRSRNYQRSGCLLCLRRDAKHRRKDGSQEY